MQDYVRIMSSSMAVATSPDKAVLAVRLSGQTRALSVDNGFDKDLVVLLDGYQLMYVRAGLTKTLDLSADNSSVERNITVELFCPDGAPSADPGQFAVVDCLL